MNLSQIRLVTFDVTNTLLKFRSSPGKQYGDVGALYGVLADDNVLAENFRAHWHKLSREHPNFGRRTGLGWERWWKSIIAGTFKDSIYNVDSKKLDAIASHLIAVYQTTACWQQCYGALGLLSYLRSRRIPLGVISNFDPRLHATLDNTKLRHYFRFVLTSYEADAQKPDPEVFERALCMAQLADLRPEQCLHVGDTAALDYFGARAAGWQGALVRDRSAAQLVDKYPGLEVGHAYTTLYDMHKRLVESNEPELMTVSSTVTSAATRQGRVTQCHSNKL